MKFVQYQWLLCLSFLVPHDVRERVIYRCCKHEFASISQKSCSIWVTKSRLLLQTIVSQQITEAVKAECLDFEKLLCAKWFLCQSLKISLLSRLSVINIVHPTSSPATFFPNKVRDIQCCTAKVYKHEYRERQTRELRSMELMLLFLVHYPLIYFLFVLFGEMVN